ncbi:two-component regulator propeller domain-containing protein [uncultured Parabacteroides sp.]|uniref:two-component regulator propeller domain-containing protein n=1 Tax=uncultured Parabacteroides sp. TaxID=512312 RepID=UPI00280454BF|nr:two-component regulator propeller domain-containing protein [uncultured Parabacteroides sp.]
MRRTIISFILLVGFCTGIYPIYFKHIGMREGLSQLSVMAIYQDNLGRMWFGTEEGISIYDGVRTTVYKPSEYHRGILTRQAIGHAPSPATKMEMFSSNPTML